MILPFQALLCCCVSLRNTEGFELPSPAPPEDKRSALKSMQGRLCEGSRREEMDSTQACDPSDYVGSREWFYIEKGLNNCGYIPGLSKSGKNDLPAAIVSEAECLARWKRDASGFRYASMESEESPRMQDRIETLYRVTHQRPMGRTKATGLTFARGVLAKKKGYAVNWAKYAERQVQRRKKRGEPYVPRTIVEPRNPDQRKAWVFDLEMGSAVYDLEQGDEDWELNRSLLNTGPTSNPAEFDMRAKLRTYPSQVIGRPMSDEMCRGQGLLIHRRLEEGWTPSIQPMQLRYCLA
ncbi:hypothetical protein KC19_VG180600, partial [Ceratodon purpureus]